MKYWSYILLIILWPSVSFAGVTISEVAWMGDSESANNEWIELHNTDTADVDITDWTLTDSGTLNITLAGVLGAGDYAVLERNRTSGNYLFNPPFLVYSGALVNSGTTLTLKRADGSLEDQVSGGENWSIGGDNATKQTAQYSDTGGWVTAPATPGLQNAGESAVVPEAETASTTPVKNTSSSSSGGGKTSSKKVTTVKFVSPPGPLQLDLDIQNTGYVNQTIPFAVKASGLGETLLSSLKYEWNFGDLSTSTFKNPYHIYNYPGTYVVTLKAFFAKEEQIVRQSITILPVQFSITRNSQGDIQINNNSPYEIDLSGYVLSGDKKILFPPRTILLAKNTITIPLAKISFTQNGPVALYDSLNSVVTTTGLKKENNLAEKVIVSAPIKNTVSVTDFAPTDTDFKFLSNIQTQGDEKELFANDDATAPNQEVIAIPGHSQSAGVLESAGSASNKSYLGMILLILLATLGVFFIKRNNAVL